MTDKTIDERIIEALSHTGSSEYAPRSGSTLTLMSELAREGNIPAMSRAFIAYATLFPNDAERISHTIPAIILNQYIYIHEKRPAGSLQHWTEKNGTWAQEIKDALRDPDQLQAVTRKLSQDAGRETSQQHG